MQYGAAGTCRTRRVLSHVGQVSSLACCKPGLQNALKMLSDSLHQTAAAGFYTHLARRSHAHKHTAELKQLQEVPPGQEDRAEAP